MTAHGGFGAGVPPMSRHATPAEVWHPGTYLSEEMAARGWTAADVAREMGDLDHKSLIINELVVTAICGEILLPDDAENEIGEETAGKLARAFGTSPELWLNLDKAWHEGRKRPGTICHRWNEP